MGILIVTLLMVGFSYFLIHWVGKICPPLGNFVFKYSKLLGPLLVAYWLYFVLHNDTKNPAMMMLAVGLVLTLMPNKKRFS
ncbi:hypothetical protein D3C80_682630 [compost metagenome]